MPVQYGDVNPVLDDRHYRKINRRYGGPPVVVMDLLRNPPRVRALNYYSSLLFLILDRGYER